MNFKHQAPTPVAGSFRATVGIIFSDDYFAAKCFNLWEAHLAWLHSLGFERALDQQSLTAEQMGGPTGHEVVDLLADFIFQTGYVNAHLGLTSSDIVDNVRLMQVQESLARLRTGLETVVERIYAQLACHRRTIGFTHWQPAAPVSWEYRVKGWLEPINYLLATPPCIFAKRFGGPVGDRASLMVLLEHLKEGDRAGALNLISSNPFDWHQFNLEHPNNAHPIQSSDHQCEMAAVNWCCAVAAQLHKIALDLRFLISRRIVILNRPPGHAGSSSMPHKMNPHRLEKICSMCRSLASTQHEMWEVAAHNSLERTLDTSWQIKVLLPRCLLTLAEIVDTFGQFEVSIGPEDASQFAAHRDLISSDVDLMRRVIAGKSRWEAYTEALSIHNNPQKS